MRGSRQIKWAGWVMAWVAALGAWAQRPSRLDLYRAPQGVGPRAEVLLLLDFSPSMDRMLPHPEFPGTADCEASRSDCPRATYAVRAWLEGTPGQRRLRSELVCREGEPADRGRLAALFQIEGLGLLRPDGQPVGEALVARTPVDPHLPGSEHGVGDVRNWVRASSHARFRFRRAQHWQDRWDQALGVSLPHGTTRTLDLPLPWCIVNVPRRTDGTFDPQAAFVYEVPLRSRLLPDPGPNGTPVEPDRTHRAEFAGDGQVAHLMVGSSPATWVEIHEGKGLWRLDYLHWLITARNPHGKPLIPDAVEGPALPAARNGIPMLTRLQALKVAVVEACLQHQGRMDLAWRLVAPQGLKGADPGCVGPCQASEVPLASLRANAGPGWTRVGADGAFAGLRRLAKLRSSVHVGHPLASLADAYVQQGYRSPWPEPREARNCQSHLLVFMTDGGSLGEVFGLGRERPYRWGPRAGNRWVMGAPKALEPGGDGWNPGTLAGAAAHLSDLECLPDAMRVSALEPSGASSWLVPYLPLAIAARGSHDWRDRPHRIRSLVFLPGPCAASAEIRRHLVHMAQAGDPWDRDIPGSEEAGAPGMREALGEVGALEGLSQLLAGGLGPSRWEAGDGAVTTALHSAGDRVYAGQLEASAGGGWTGDLLALSSNADPRASLSLRPDQALWSGRRILAARPWEERRVYTRPTATRWESDPPLVALHGPGGLAGCPEFLPGLPEPDRQRHLAWLLGRGGPPGRSRSDLFGGVLEGGPVSLDYAVDPALIRRLPGTLAGVWRTGAIFRVIFVGTLQGVVHAFGEVSWKEGGRVQAVAEELWAFLPTDFLGRVDHFRDPVQGAPTGVDGPFLAYHLDLPTGGKALGDGRVGDGERALLVFGLGRGGRSTYALDVSDPLEPRLGHQAKGGHAGWALRAEEAAVVPLQRMVRDEDRSLIEHLGWATARPALGRVVAGTPARLVDALFLGGGEGGAGLPAGAGRSILALDVATGLFLRTWDLRGVDGMGPVSAGVVPTQVEASTGLVQRAYFTDEGGGLWCLGSRELQKAGRPGAFEGFRKDSSLLEAWDEAPRPVLRGKLNDGLLSTLPAVFPLTRFYPRKDPPRVVPRAVGVAFVSGARANPMDRPEGYRGAPPRQHRLTVVFDREDSGLLGLDGHGIRSDQLVDMTGQGDPEADLINPLKATTASGGPGAFYLSRAYGYTVDFPASAAPYVSKGMDPPMVLGGTLLYRWFQPEGMDPCAGGKGRTRTARIPDVLRPVVSFMAAGGNGWGSGVLGDVRGVPPAPLALGLIRPALMKDDALKGPVLDPLPAPPSLRFIRPILWRVVR